MIAIFSQLQTRRSRFLDTWVVTKACGGRRGGLVWPATGVENSSHLGAPVTFTMPFIFSFEEYADMIYEYEFCDGNSVLAVDEYQQRFPNRRIPNRSEFTGVYQALRDTGRLPGVRIAAERGVNEGIVRMVHRSPRTSTRRIARRLRVPHKRVWRTLHSEGMYPYHVQRVQHLRTGDFAEGLNFCMWLSGSRQLHRYIMFTDEAQFNHDGVNNTHNYHVWGDENPHSTVESNFQQRFSVNVWCAVLDDQLIGPFILEIRLTGEAYLRFVQEKLPEIWRMCLWINDVKGITITTNLRLTLDVELQFS